MGKSLKEGSGPDSALRIHGKAAEGVVPKRTDDTDGCKSTVKDLDTIPCGKPDLPVRQPCGIPYPAYKSQGTEFFSLQIYGIYSAAFRKEEKAASGVGDTRDADPVKHLCGVVVDRIRSTSGQDEKTMIRGKRIYRSFRAAADGPGLQRNRNGLRCQSIDFQQISFVCRHPQGTVLSAAHLPEGCPA